MENTQKSFIRQPGRKAEDSIRKMTIYKDSAVNAMKDSLEFDKKIVESNDEYIKKLREADATEYDILKANMEKAESEEERSAIRSRLAEMNAQRYKKDTENKEFYDDLKEQLSSKDGYKADQITTDNYEGKYVISGVTGVVRGTLSYDYKVTYQKEDVTVGNMNGTVDGSSQMSAEFVYKDGNYQLRTVNPGSIWYRESQ